VERVRKRMVFLDPGQPSTPPVTREDRRRVTGHTAHVLWLTGLSGSGKSTVANAVEARLNREFGLHTFLLDGDLIRTGLNKDLGFSAADRTENIRRIGEVARLFYEAGVIVLTAFISPFRADRDLVRALLPPGSFSEIYVSCPLEVCEGRDVKGLYRKARQGLIPHFTGIDSPYEPPERPELTLDTAAETLDESTARVIAYLQAIQVF
jgi:adenylylsulfate kinase